MSFSLFTFLNLLIIANFHNYHLQNHSDSHFMYVLNTSILYGNSVIIWLCWSTKYMNFESYTIHNIIRDKKIFPKNVIRLNNISKNLKKSWTSLTMSQLYTHSLITCTITEEESFTIKMSSWQFSGMHTSFVWGRIKNWRTWIKA